MGMVNSNLQTTNTCKETSLTLLCQSRSSSGSGVTIIIQSCDYLPCSNSSVKVRFRDNTYDSWLACFGSKPQGRKQGSQHRSTIRMCSTNLSMSCHQFNRSKTQELDCCRIPPFSVDMLPHNAFNDNVEENN